MTDYALHEMLNEIWAVTGDANRYFAAQEPWKLAKTDPARRDSVLHVTAELLRVVGICCQPFVPRAAAKLLDLLAVPADRRMLAHADATHAIVAGTALRRRRGSFRATSSRRRGRAGRGSRLMLIDSHCHLDFPDLAADLDGVLARARAAGVDRMITISTHVGRVATYRALAEAHEELFFTSARTRTTRTRSWT